METKPRKSVVALDSGHTTFEDEHITTGKIYIQQLTQREG